MKDKVVPVNITGVSFNLQVGAFVPNKCGRFLLQYAREITEMLVPFIAAGENFINQFFIV